MLIFFPWLSVQFCNLFLEVAVLHQAHKLNTGIGASYLKLWMLFYLNWHTKNLVYVFRRVFVALPENCSLQNQLLEQEIPRLAQAIGRPIEAVVVKGRSRYLCTRALENHLEADPSSSPPIHHLDLHRMRALAQSMEQALNSGSWNGDRDGWTGKLEPEQWAQLTTTREQCSGKECPHYDKSCPLYQQRRRIPAADLLITNHDLLLSDAVLNYLILPEPEESLLLLDEAHLLPEKAVNHATAHLNLIEIQETLKVVKELLKELPNLLKPLRQEVGEKVKAVEERRKTLEESLHDLQIQLRRQKVVEDLFSGEQPFCTLFAADPLLLQLRLLLGDQRTTLPPLIQLLQQALTWNNQLGREKRLSSHMVEMIQTRVGGVLTRLLNWIAFIERLFAQEQLTDEQVLWMSVGSYEQQRSLELHLGPVWGSTFLREQLWNRFYGVVLVSATLRALNSFAPFQEWAGLPAQRFAHYETFVSPFRYREQATLLLPWLETIPDGEASDDYFQEVARYLNEQVVRQAGTLILFTAQAAMQQVWSQLNPEWRQSSLMQGDHYSRQQILELHRQRIAAGEPSQLFGLQSFAEGLDLPGDLCRHVVITRLPFPSFQSPLGQARERWLENRQRNAFGEWSLPQCSIALLQACGRLLRHEHDRGQITLLDRRLVVKMQSYGRTLLQALPPFRREVVQQRPQGAAVWSMDQAAPLPHLRRDRGGGR